MLSTLLSLKSGFGGREYHHGSVLANRLGLQLARMLAMNALVHAARRDARPTDPIRERLERDGVVVVPDYLPAETFAAIRAEFEAAREAGLLAQIPLQEDDGIVECRGVVAKHREAFPVLSRALGENVALRGLIGDVAGRRMRKTELVISVIRQGTERVRPERFIGANYIHADLHFPFLKAWLYLHDIDESNAALVYARGSHRISLGRLAYEYEASVRVARFKRQQGDLRSSLPYGLIRRPRPDQLARMGIRETSVPGKANSLVIANTMGFHRRGEFKADRTREMVMIRVT